MCPSKKLMTTIDNDTNTKLKIVPRTNESKFAGINSELALSHVL